MQKTPNYNLNKPEQTDVVNIEDLNANFDTLDAEVAKKVSITDFPSSLPANGGNAATVNGKTVLENVPVGAKFTDTVTSINGKTGAITKADITALGIPAQDTVYTHPSTHPPTILASGALPVGITATNGTDYTTARVRNIHANIYDVGAGAALNSGAIYIVYE